MRISFWPPLQLITYTKIAQGILDILLGNFEIWIHSGRIIPNYVLQIKKKVDSIISPVNISNLDLISAAKRTCLPIKVHELLVGRRLAARTLPPVTIRELRLALQDEWAAMPQQLINTLILSMGRRCETCLAVRGDHIPY
ncbi:hypothetical protein TNCV_2472091 [Trichonephila clavipes]|nr:hypothetical protein TNCV_2472091 [Trichonephila clavipes]